jgi:hypothetical protein
MTRSDDHTSIRVEDDGKLLAEADVQQTDDPGVVRSALHVEAGHLPVGTGTRLVDAVLESPAVEGAERLLASMPISDSEMLGRLRERTDELGTRAAGATKIVETRLEK